MKKRISTFKLKTVVVDTGTENNPDDCVQLTNWVNGDGVHIDVFRGSDTFHYSFTNNELDAIIEALESLK